MINQVTSKQNQYIKLVKQLSRRKEREKTGLFVLEGSRSLEEVLKADYQIEVILISSSFEDSVKGHEFIERAKTDFKVLEVPDSIFNHLSSTETPQGVLVIVRKKKFSVQDILDSSKEFLVIADEIQDPGNLGTIIRTAAAAGAAGVLLTNGCVDIYNPKVIRATMGGIFYLPIVEIESKSDVVEILRRQSYQLMVADLSGQDKYYDVNLQGKIALVIGNENKGPSQEFISNASHLVKIPLVGPVESLNASVAAGVLIYEIVRQRGL